MYTSGNMTRLHFSQMHAANNLSTLSRSIQPCLLSLHCQDTVCVGLLQTIASIASRWWSSFFSYRIIADLGIISPGQRWYWEARAQRLNSTVKASNDSHLCTCICCWDYGIGGISKPLRPYKRDQLIGRSDKALSHTRKLDTPQMLVYLTRALKPSYHRTRWCDSN